MVAEMAEMWIKKSFHSNNIDIFASSNFGGPPDLNIGGGGGGGGLAPCFYCRLLSLVSTITWTNRIRS